MLSRASASLTVVLTSKLVDGWNNENVKLSKCYESFTRCFLEREQVGGCELAWERYFSIPTTCECKKLKWIRLHQLGLKVSPPDVSVPTTQPVFREFKGSRHLPRFWGKSQKQQLRLLYQSHQKVFRYIYCDNSIATTLTSSTVPKTLLNEHPPSSVRLFYGNNSKFVCWWLCKETAF